MSDPTAGPRPKYLGTAGSAGPPLPAAGSWSTSFATTRTGSAGFCARVCRCGPTRLVITHPHFDHDAVETVSGDPRVIDQRDELRDADYALRICHAADNQAEIDEALRNEIGSIDLLTAAAWLAPLKFFGLALILTGIAFALSAIIKVLCAQA